MVEQNFVICAAAAAVAVAVALGVASSSKAPALPVDPEAKREAKKLKKEVASKEKAEKAEKAKAEAKAEAQADAKAEAKSAQKAADAIAAVAAQEKADALAAAAAEAALLPPVKAKKISKAAAAALKAANAPAPAPAVVAKPKKKKAVAVAAPVAAKVVEVPVVEAPAEKAKSKKKKAKKPTEQVTEDFEAAVDTDEWTVVKKPSDVQAAKKVKAAVVFAASGDEEIVSEVIQCGDKMAFVIGASGATIKFIESASGCKLETSKDGGAKPTAVTLKGGRDAVDKARKLVLAAVSGVDVTAEATETLELAQAGDIATIIGKGGSTIKALQASTGARVDAQRRSSGPAAVVVSGTKDQVAAAVLAIKGLLADASNSEILELACHVGVILGKGGTVIRGIQDASQARVDVAAVDGAQDRCIVTLAGSKQQIAAAKALVNAAVDDKDKPVLEPGDVLENVVLPEACVGTIIGKGGESIKKLQAETGAKVDVSKTKASCAVYGPSAAVKKAVAFIRDVVDKQAKLDAQKLVERLAFAADNPSTDAGWGSAADSAAGWGAGNDDDVWAAPAQRWA